jgi:hypothetical protein
MLRAFWGAIIRYSEHVAVPRWLDQSSAFGSPTEDPPSIGKLVRSVLRFMSTWVAFVAENVSYLCEHFI